MYYVIQTWCSDQLEQHCKREWLAQNLCAWKIFNSLHLSPSCTMLFKLDVAISLNNIVNKGDWHEICVTWKISNSLYLSPCTSVWYVAISLTNIVNWRSVETKHVCPEKFPITFPLHNVFVWQNVAISPNSTVQGVVKVIHVCPLFLTD